MGDACSTCVSCTAPAQALAVVERCTAERVDVRPQGVPIDPHYMLAEEIGRGGYAKVRLCTHKRSGIKRACKSIEKTLGASCEASARTEIDILLRLQWAGRGRGLIVRLFEVFEDRTFVHLILELCAGGELYERQSKIGTFDETQAKCLFQQMLSAVSHLHRHFIAHRDLKLENWLFMHPAPNLELRLCDFGLSMVLKPGEKARDRVGSVYYVAPEVLHRSYDRRADLWSAGVILFMLLSGLPPFNGAKPEDILNEIAIAQPNFDASVWRRVSDDPKDLIQQLLDRDPEARPSAEEALENTWIRGVTAAMLKQHR